MSAMAETGPISSNATPAIADTVSGTTIMPDAEAPDGDRDHQVGEVWNAAVERGAVDHRREDEDAPDDHQRARREDGRQVRRESEADAQRNDERDETDPRAKCAVAHDVLHVEADQHRQGEHHPTREEHRREGGDPVAFAEQTEGDHRVHRGAFDEDEGR